MAATYYLPGDERIHWAAFLPASSIEVGAWGWCRLTIRPYRLGARVTRWFFSESHARQVASAIILPVRVRSEWRSWEVSEAEWMQSEDAENWRLLQGR